MSWRHSSPECIAEKDFWKSQEVLSSNAFQGNRCLKLVGAVTHQHPPLFLSLSFLASTWKRRGNCPQRPRTGVGMQEEITGKSGNAGMMSGCFGGAVGSLSIGSAEHSSGEECGKS